MGVRPVPPADGLRHLADPTDLGGGNRAGHEHFVAARIVESLHHGDRLRRGDGSRSGAIASHRHRLVIRQPHLYRDQHAGMPPAQLS